MSIDDQNSQSLVAVRERTDSVIAALSAHFSNDVLSMDEFERRVDLAHRATSAAQLDALTADLGPPTTGADLAVQDSAAAVATRTVQKKRILSVLSSVERKGGWHVPARLRLRTFMGAIELDFREAEFGPGVTEVTAISVMGAVSITVPHDLRVECDGTGFLGHFEGLEQAPAGADPDAPLLRIKGVALMGALEISVDRSGRW